MTTPDNRPTSSTDARTRNSATQGVTVIMTLVMGLSFLFGVGNSWTLGAQLDVPAYVAPLVAPAVDLSVIGLLLGIRHLALSGATTQQMRPAWRLLTFAGFVTLVLQRHLGVAALLVVAVSGLVLAASAPVRPGPDEVGGMQPVEQGGDQSADLG